MYSTIASFVGSKSSHSSLKVTSKNPHVSSFIFWKEAWRCHYIHLFTSLCVNLPAITRPITMRCTFSVTTSMRDFIKSMVHVYVATKSESTLSNSCAWLGPWLVAFFSSLVECGVVDAGSILGWFGQGSCEGVSRLSSSLLVFVLLSPWENPCARFESCRSSALLMS